MKVAVVGSRSLNVNVGKYIPEETDLIISGGAKGIDTLAEKFADSKGIKKLIIKPNYEKYGRAAPHIRNRDIVNNADLVIALWDGKSKGTMNTVEYAQKCGKKVKLHELKNEEEYFI